MIQINQIVNVGAQILGQFRNLSETDVEIAKASLKSRLARRFSSAVRRNEEISKALYYLNETGQDYRSKIDRVTASSVNAAVAKAIKSNLTFVVEGGQVSNVPSYDKISQLFN